jgi:hypothetical protein
MAITAHRIQHRAALAGRNACTTTTTDEAVFRLLHAQVDVEAIVRNPK